MDTGLLLVGHGSRDATANVEFASLVAQVRAAHPSMSVAHGYVELAQPLLDDALLALAAVSRRVVAMPVFLFTAGHVKNDLPLALQRGREAYPQVQFTAARAFNVHPAMVDIATSRLNEVAGPLDAAARQKTWVVVVGRGTSDPDTNGDFCKLTRLIGEGQGFAAVQPAFIGVTTPSVDEALAQAGRLRPQRVVVLPYFLFHGRLINNLRERIARFSAEYPWIKVQLGAHLGPDARLVPLINERVQQAREGSAPLPCDTCQYRIPLGASPSQVGGLKALLWSLRHTFTHGQAMPHVHAHKPLHKHVLVCGNVDCAAAGSMDLINRLRRLIKAAGRAQDIRVTRTSCMGRCGEGPTVAVYPDGIWYRTVCPSDASELVQEHLLEDRLVGRLIDNIMQ